MPRPTARPRVRTLLRAAALLALIGLLSACGLVLPTPHTNQAKEVFWLYVVVLVLGGIVFFGVEGFIIYAVIRYRRRDDRLPTQIHGNRLVEVIWTAIPTAIVLILFVLSTITLVSISAAAKPGVTVEVDGFQWQWTFHYLDGDTDAKNDVSITGTPAAPPQMVLPVGEPVKLILVSKDVIHSFFVPAFLVKRDVVPLPNNQHNELEFTISDTGTYSGQCAEFCGDLHARMTFSVKAVTRAEYDKWFTAAKAGETPAPSVPAEGAVLKLAADHTAYDTQTLEAPAGKAFTIEFTDKEAISHNVAIYKGDEAIFHGTIITGPDKTVSYVIDALPPGEYKFICDVHPIPSMTGTLTIK